MDEREAKLPKWAQDLITDLRKRVEHGNEPLLKELAQLRPKMELIKARNEAMTELFECAAKGGHATAQEIVQIIEGYDLVLQPKKKEPT
jgi:hypothetical protein